MLHTGGKTNVLPKDVASHVSHLQPQYLHLASAFVVSSETSLSVVNTALKSPHSWLEFLWIPFSQSRIFQYLQRWENYISLFFVSEQSMHQEVNNSKLFS